MTDPEQAREAALAWMADSWTSCISALTEFYLSARAEEAERWVPLAYAYRKSLQARAAELRKAAKEMK